MGVFNKIFLKFDSVFWREDYEPRMGVLLRGIDVTLIPGCRAPLESPKSRRAP